MDLDADRSMYRVALIQFTHSGARSRCPFCKGRMIASVSSGDRILVLKGMFAGQEATVLSQPSPVPDEFIVQFDFQAHGEAMRMHYTRDAFVHSPIAEVPPWLCSLSIDDLSALEDAALEMSFQLARIAKGMWSVETILPLVATVRHRRLPVVGADLWLMLEAHGLSPKLKSSFCRAFDFGVQLLVSLHGRPPIRRRRVPAMSIGRYLTPKHQELVGPSPGISTRQPG